MSYYFLITIDVEDWFQVENFKKYIPFDSWSSYELRVEKNTHRLLDLFDSIEMKKTKVRMQKTVCNNETRSSRIQYLDNGQQSTDDGQDEKVRGTFFVLGWLAERLPHLVQEIHSRGHEVASHGYRHNLCNQESFEELKRDLSDSKKCLEDIIGIPVYGYRAPSFSINGDILKIIEDCGYLYDSSYNSFSMHGRYGKAHLSQNMKKGIAAKISDTFYELPVGNLKFAWQVFPWGGGGYFRLIPFPLFRLGIKSILKEKGAYLFYMHPWEIDPEQPKVDNASMFYKFRHYLNISRTYSKLHKFLKICDRCHFVSCYQYLEGVSIDRMI
jgi:polysaccharide deacetylase family protein (PEP-CTERM system associated)